MLFIKCVVARYSCLIIVRKKKLKIFKNEIQFYFHNSAMAGPQPGWERRRVKVMVLEKCWVEWIVMFCVGESKWALLRVHVSTERVLVLGTACRWQSMWVNNQPYARPSRMYINAGRCVGACFTAETLGYNWCISLLSAWFDGIFEDALYPFIFYFLFFFIFWVAGQVKLSSKEMLSLGLGARIKVDDWFAAS